MTMSISRILPLLTVLTLACASPMAATDEGVTELTLDRALSAAMTNSPVIRAAEAEVAEARGRLIGGRTYPYNPELGLEGAGRDGPEGSTTDRSLSLSQQIEIAGQRGKRAAVANSELASVLRRLERRRQEVVARVERAFARAIGARELVEVAESDLTLTRGLLGFERKRLDSGAGTQLELNLAQAAAGRAERRFQLATAEWMAARTLLAEAAGLNPASPPVPVGSFPTEPVSITPLENLVAEALERRPDLASLRQEQEVSRRSLRLERSLAVPDLRLGAFSSREEHEDIRGVGLAIAIPFFNRNQGRVAEARAAVDRTAAETLSGELALRQEVTEARARLEAATAAVGALKDLVVGTLEESLQLLQRAMEAGKVSATNVLLLRRDLIEGRREHVEAAMDAWIARVDLELATGDVKLTEPGREANDAP